ncbi:MAG TPA: uracil-DNA glycosylase [Solirubrobacteraceae bacterium]|nr:uracil-DNA glycosylase [Solirubrobacteraceae bacterium]
MATERTSKLERLESEVTRCRRCPRLVAWREQVAREKRRAFADEVYWGRPVPAFGDVDASLLVLGLAPAAHGANRTGRMFTGDRSGDFLYAGLWRAGLASAPRSASRDDGLRLTGARVSAAVRCAPPANKPTPLERDTCEPWTQAELALLDGVRVVLALGAFAWRSALRLLAGDERGGPVSRPLPRFTHGAEVTVGLFTLLGCFHPSQQNTFTGRLTPAMLDAVLARATEVADTPRIMH